MRCPTTRPLAFALVAALGVAGAGCRDQAADDGASVAPDDDGAGDEASAPFVVDPAGLPGPLTPLAAGTGLLTQDWGSDSFGTHEPFTVLAPPGSDAGDDAVVIVSTTGFEGYQGGLEQASNGYLDADAEAFDYEGRPAIYTPPADGDEADDAAYGARGGWADLVAERGDDVAVRVSARDGDRDDLVDMLDRVVVPDDHAEAPDVVRPPAGLDALGSGDADLVLSAFPGVDRGNGDLYVAESAHAVAWGLPTGPPGPTTTTVPPPEPADLVVVTLPGDAGDLAALGAPGTLFAYGTTTASEVDGGVGDRPAVVLEHTAEGDPSLHRTLVTVAPWGDLLLVGVAGRPEDLPPIDALVAVAAATREATTAEFEAQATPA